MPVTFPIPGAYGMFEAAPDEERAQQAPVYRIPPVVWMFIFLLAGWLILRAVLED